jgi:hypothetical protein
MTEALRIEYPLAEYYIKPWIDGMLTRMKGLGF